MGLDDNAYGSVAEVAALSRLYLQGESTFNTTTWPQASEVENWLNYASGKLNLALATAGFTIPITQADAKRACEGWVVEQVASMVEYSQPTAVHGRRNNQRANFMARLYETAVKFVKANQTGFQTLGVSVTKNDASALSFTGATAQKDRSDPDNTSLEQPKFKRGQFDA